MRPINSDVLALSAIRAEKDFAPEVLDDLIQTRTVTSGRVDTDKVCSFAHLLSSLGLT
jgi:hypothetical protein